VGTLRTVNWDPEAFCSPTYVELSAEAQPKWQHFLPKGMDKAKNYLAEYSDGYLMRV
jgi:hypothetical protein